MTIRDAIREVDDNHIIVAEGSWWSSDLTKIDWTDPMVQSSTGYSQQWDDNLVYQLHHYGPASGTYGREAFAEKLNIPVFIGEYGETDEANLKAITDWAKQTLEGYFPWLVEFIPCCLITIRKKLTAIFFVFQLQVLQENEPRPLPLDDSTEPSLHRREEFHQKWRNSTHSSLRRNDHLCPNQHQEWSRQS